jgi:hypothetical protein
MMKAKRCAVLIGALLLGGVDVPAFAVICPGQRGRLGRMK